MLGYYTKEEKDAFKAGARKGEKNAEANISVLQSSLTDLWAKLGATSQGQALRSIENREIVGDDIRRANESMMRLVSEKSAMIDELTSRCNKFNEQVNEIREARDDAQRRINELNAGSDKEREAWGYTRAEFENRISDQADRILDQAEALKSAERECNRLSAELTEVQNGAQRQIDKLCRELGAARSMAVHFRKDRDKLDDTITQACHDKANPIFKSGYDAGLKDGKAEREFDHTTDAGNYFTKGLAAHIQMQGRGLRPMPAEVPEIKDYAGGTVRASITVDEFDKELAATRKKLFGVT